ncbi:Pyrimidine-specific ribonucleoside hydrolase RihB, partial [Durusdinium trenchii]
ASALVKQAGHDTASLCGASRTDFQSLLGACPVLVYRGLINPKLCQESTQILLEGRFAEWRLGQDPDAPASDYTKIGYTKTDVLIQEGFRMTATSAAPEKYISSALETTKLLQKALGGDFFHALASKFAPLGISLQLEQCPLSQRPFLPCVVRRMEPGGRRKEGNIHMDTVVPGSTLSLNVYLNVPEMSGGELVIFPVIPQYQTDTSEQLKALEARVAALEAPEDAGVLPARKAGTDAQIMKKVAKRLQDFESQITAQLSNLQTDFDKKLSHVNRGAAATKPIDGAAGSAGLDTMAEDLDQLKYDVGELKDLLGNNKGEVNHIRRIVLACERDMEDFTAAMDAVNVDLDEMRARVDATHSIITSRQRVEATMTAEISTMRLDIGDIQEALKNHDSWMEDVSNTLQQMQEKEENLTEDIINLKNEMCTKLDTKVDNVAWKEANDDLDAAIKTVRDMVSSLRLDVDARRRKVDEILATVRHDITAVETNLEESKAKITSDTDQAVNALNGRIDFTNKVRSDLERNVADTEARLKNDIRQKQQEAFEKIGAVEQQAELRSAEASRRLGALDLRMSGVQGGERRLGEHKRDILKLREEVNGLTVKSASHEVDIQKNSDAVRKMEKQRNMDEQNWKATHRCAAAYVYYPAQVVVLGTGPRMSKPSSYMYHASVESSGVRSQLASKERSGLRQESSESPSSALAKPPSERKLFKSTSLPNLEKEPMRQRPRTAEGVRSLTNDSPGFRAASHASHLFTAQATAFKRRPQTASGENNKGSYSLMCWRETTDDIRTFPYRGLKGSMAPPAFARSLMMPEMRKAGLIFSS